MESEKNKMKEIGGKLSWNSKELVHHNMLSILKQCLSWSPKSSGNFICIFPFSDTSGNLLNEYRIFCVQCTEFGE